jgi:hypothetical protein
MGSACGMHGRDKKLNKILLQVLKATNQSEETAVDRRTILKFILKVYCVRMLIDSSGSRQSPKVGFCELDNEHSETIRGGKFFDQFKDCNFSGTILFHGLRYM